MNLYNILLPIRRSAGMQERLTIALLPMRRSYGTIGVQIRFSSNIMQMDECNS
jgi:hypothetical protein